MNDDLGHQLAADLLAALNARPTPAQSLGTLSSGPGVLRALQALGAAGTIHEFLNCMDAAGDVETEYKQGRISLGEIQAHRATPEYRAAVTEAADLLDAALNRRSP